MSCYLIVPAIGDTRSEGTKFMSYCALLSTGKVRIF